jgi:hypothetical protein
MVKGITPVQSLSAKGNAWIILQHLLSHSLTHLNVPMAIQQDVLRLEVAVYYILRERERVYLRESERYIMS